MTLDTQVEHNAQSGTSAFGLPLANAREKAVLRPAVVWADG